MTMKILWELVICFQASMEEELTAIWVKSKKALWQLEQDNVQNLSLASRENPSRLGAVRFKRVINLLTASTSSSPYLTCLRVPSGIGNSSRNVYCVSVLIPWKNRFMSSRLITELIFNPLDSLQGFCLQHSTNPWSQFHVYYFHFE